MPGCDHSHHSSGSEIPHSARSHVSSSSVSSRRKASARKRETPTVPVVAAPCPHRERILYPRNHHIPPAITMLPEHRDRLDGLRQMYGIGGSRRPISDDEISSSIPLPAEDLVAWGVNLDIDVLLRECDDVM